MCGISIFRCGRQSYDVKRGITRPVIVRRVKYYYFESQPSPGVGISPCSHRPVSAQAGVVSRQKYFSFSDIAVRTGRDIMSVRQAPSYPVSSQRRK